MADTNKKVNVEFSDNGSIQRLKQMYGQAFIPPNQNGGYTPINNANPLLAQQQRAIFGNNGSASIQNTQMLQGIEAAKSTFATISDAFKKLDRANNIFKSELDKYNTRVNTYESNKNTLYRNNPEQGRKEYEAIRAEERRLNGVGSGLSTQERELLSGTGYRKRNTFERGSEKEIARAEKEYEKLVQQQEKTNTILSNWQTQDRKQTADQVKAIEKNANATTEEKTAAKIYRESQEPERIQRRQQLVNIGGNAALALVAGLTQAGIRYSDYNRQTNMQTNGYDAVQANGEMKGDITKIGWQTGGAVVGGAIAGATIGTGVGGLLGAGAGLLIGGLIGEIRSNAEKSENEQAVRFLKYREDFLKAGNKQNALSGMGSNYGDTSTLNSMGYNSLDFANASIGFARARGSSRGIRGATMQGLEYEKGWGIDRSVTADVMNMARSNRSNDRDIQNIIGGVFEKGKDIFKGDRTYLGEFLTNKFLPLQRELLKNQTNVSTGTTMDVLSRFNSVGGQFDSMHQNSSALISQINGALINPASDSANAISFQALRGANPGMGLFNTLKERQRGVSSPTYLKAMMQMISKMGGSEDIQKLNMAGLLGLDNNLDAVDSLYKNRGKIMNGSISQKALHSLMNPTSDAVKNTTDEEKFEAKLYSTILSDFTKAGEVVRDRMKVLMDEIKGGGLSITINGDGTYTHKVLPVNTTKQPFTKSMQQTVTSTGGIGGGSVPVGGMVFK